MYLRITDEALRTRNCKLHYSEVRGDVLRPPHGTYTSDNKDILKVMILSNEHTFKADNRHIIRFLGHTSLGQLALISETHVIIPVPGMGSIVTIYQKISTTLWKKKVREKSREYHNHKPQPISNTKKKRKQTKQNKRKSNKRTKNTKISPLFPKRGNRKKDWKTQEQNNTRQNLKQIASYM